MATILCVDDEPAIGVLLEEMLRGFGHQAHLARDTEAAMAVVSRVPVDLIISDYQMPRGTGLDLLATLQQEGYRIPFVIMTGYSTIEHAVESIRRGATDYLTKPVRPETLEIAIHQALELVRLQRENESYKQQLARLGANHEIVGDSPALRRVLEMVATVAPTRATVLLEGESGTGKELFARALHEQGPRREGPFVALNCAAMPEGLIESALFGHEKGAFTGATARAAGAFERAHRGTLLLDEISEMRLDLQSKLLRVIQEQQFERVGGHALVTVDVRIVATTNRDLKAAIAAGTFREDLYYRLSVVPIHTPSLRERTEDIALLVQHFARRTASELGVAAPKLLPDAVTMLQRYRWPGNIRELANVIERAVILARGGPLGPELFTAITGAAPVPAAATPASGADTARGRSAPGISDEVPSDMCNLGDVERILIERALRTTHGNRTRAAALLGISERTLRNKLNSPQAVV
jgi:DNA-binding NtrC family response regulator